MVYGCIHAYWFCVACIFNKICSCRIQHSACSVLSSTKSWIFSSIFFVLYAFCVCLWIDHSATKLCLFKFSGSNELVWCLRLLASTLSVIFNCSRWLCHIWYGMTGWHTQTHTFNGFCFYLLCWLFQLSSNMKLWCEALPALAQV